MRGGLLQIAASFRHGDASARGVDSAGRLSVRGCPARAAPRRTIGALARRVRSVHAVAPNRPWGNPAVAVISYGPEASQTVAARHRRGEESPRSGEEDAGC